MTQERAAQILEQHGHTVHREADRLVAESRVSSTTFAEYGTFAAPYSARELRDWLGY